MFNKRNKFAGIVLAAIWGTVLLALSPTLIYAQYYVNNYSQLTITTTNATNITNASAILNGQVNGGNLYNTYNLETWFEYGTGANIAYSTLHHPSNSGYANFISNVSNLSPNTVYFFRAVAQTPQGVIYGDTNSFRTNFQNTANIDNNNNAGTLTAITQPATSISNTSARLNSLILNPTDDSANTWFEYGTSLNLGNMTTLVPTGSVPSVKHVNTMNGLSPGTTYYFRAVTQNSNWKNSGSILSFTTSGAKVSASTATKTPTITSTDAITKTNTPAAVSGIGSYLGASVFGAGSFFPINIFGWLILIILILTLILLSKHLYGKFSDPKLDNKHI